MPQTEGGYVSLPANTGPSTVYQTTTEPSTAPKSVFDSVKRAIGQAIGQPSPADGDQDSDALLSAAGVGQQNAQKPATIIAAGSGGGIGTGR